MNCILKKRAALPLFLFKASFSQRAFNLSFFTFFSILLFVLSSCSDSKDAQDLGLSHEAQDIQINWSSSDSTFALTWSSPSDTVGLVKWHVWVELDSNQHIIKDGSVTSTDLAISSQGDKALHYTLDPRTLQGALNGKFLFPKEMLNLSQKLNLPFAKVFLWGEYSSGSATLAQVRTLWLKDVFPADPTQSTWISKAETLIIAFSRPHDQVSASTANNSLGGLIAGYNLELSGLPQNYTLNSLKVQIVTDSTLSPLYIKPSYELIAPQNFVTLDTNLHLKAAQGFKWAIIDFHPQFKNIDSNRILIKIIGLPINADTSYHLSYKLSTFDAQGNRFDWALGQNASVDLVNFVTTDGFPPLFNPNMILDPVSTAGKRTLKWNLATDPSGIAYYKLIQINSFLGKSDTIRKDLKEDQNLAGQAILNNMIPGQNVKYALSAVDQSGYQSEWHWGNENIPFSVPTLNCPTGMVPNIGSSKTNGSYCIDAFEHQISNQFQSNISAQEAQKSCSALSNGEFTVDLCTENEWVNSCISTSDSTKTNYGFISTGIDSLDQYRLQKECAYASGDSSATFNLSKRNINCVTPEGVYDLPGQLQEWVYTLDSLGHKQFKLKGGSWISPNNTSFISVMPYAKCNAYAIPQAKRPNFVIYSPQIQKVFKYSNNFISLSSDSLTRKLNGNIIDTLTTNELAKDSMYVYDIYPNSNNTSASDWIASDTVQYTPNSVGLKSIQGGVHYVYKNSIPVFLVLKTSERQYYSKDASLFTAQKNIGYRCCAWKK